jgi:hypothetical protein
MSNQSPTVAGYKRKRIPKKNASLRESDTKAAEAVTHKDIVLPTKTGNITKRIKVPLVAIPNASHIESTVPENTIDMAMDVDHNGGYEPEEIVHNTKSHKVRDSMLMKLT